MVSREPIRLPEIHYPVFNKRLSQQPALGALTFFVAGNANFCSQLFAFFSALHCG